MCRHAFPRSVCLLKEKLIQYQQSPKIKIAFCKTFLKDTSAPGAIKYKER